MFLLTKYSYFVYFKVVFNFSNILTSFYTYINHISTEKLNIFHIFFSNNIFIISKMKQSRYQFF